MITDITLDGRRRGALIWGPTSLPAGAVVLGTIRREGDQDDEEAVVRTSGGVVMGGRTGRLRELPPEALREKIKKGIEAR